MHNVVYDVVQQVFNGAMDRGFNRRLSIDLFETGRITEKIVEGQKRSDKAQQERKMRLGYMGHLTLVAEEVVKYTERQAPETLDRDVVDRISDPEWIHYLEHTLAETRDRDHAILGGVRPDSNLGPKQAVLNTVATAQGGYGNSITNSAALPSPGLDSMDLANAGGTGYNFNNAALISGFGNSDDEEEEEMEENEFRQDNGDTAHHSELDLDYQVGHTYTQPSFKLRRAWSFSKTMTSHCTTHMHKRLPLLMMLVCVSMLLLSISRKKEFESIRPLCIFLFISCSRHLLLPFASY